MPRRAVMWKRRSVLLLGAMAAVAFAGDSPAGTGRYAVLIFAPDGPAAMLGATRLAIKDGGPPALGDDLLFADVYAKGLAAIVKDGPKGKARLVYEVPGRKIFTKRDAQAEAAGLISGGQRAPGVYYLFALFNAAPGQDGAFNAFYDTTRLPDMLGIPGMVWGMRGRLVTAASAAGDAPGYLAVYQFRSYDLAATIAEVKRRRDAGIVRAFPEGMAGTGAMIVYAAPAGR